MFHMEQSLAKTPKILLAPPHLLCPWEGRLLHVETPRAKSTVGVTPRAKWMTDIINNKCACDTINTATDTMALENLNIVSGTFSAKGNFTGRTSLNKKTFIHSGTMKAKGWDSIDKVKFPFIAVSEIAQVAKTTARELVNDDGTIVMEYVPVLNAEGQPTFDLRETTVAVFANKQEAIAAHIAESSLNNEINEAVAYAQKNYKLDDATLQKLTANAAF
jgi:hypothetical protein